MYSEYSSFEDVLPYLKRGEKIARKHWYNDIEKEYELFLYLVQEAEYSAQTEVALREFGETVKYKSYIAMKLPDNTVTQWTTSHLDLLANDWLVIIKTPQA